MLRDVFYYGSKPNVHPREKFAKSLEDARRQATTDHFWIINEHCDYRGFDWDFDFEFLPDEDVWAENHNNVWPSQHQKDSGTWLCPKKYSDIIVYRNDADPIKRKNSISHNWKILEKIDTTKFDFSWHPDPTDPPYIYAWGCKFFPVEFYPCLEYHAIGATEYKYMDNIVELLPNLECIVEYQEIDKDKFDLSWRPDPMDPPYIYVWGNKYIPAEIQPTLEYHVPGATEKKYMHEILHVLPEFSKWEIPDNIDTTDFDLSWRPDPREPDYIWQFGTQWQKTGGPKYKSISSNEIKYVDTQFAYHLPHHESFVILEDIDESSFDFSWHPDSNEPPYIYVWGNNHVPGEIASTIEYRVEGASVKKYVHNDVILKSKKEKFIVHRPIAESTFDFTWRPNPNSPPYNYIWGNKYVPGELQPTVEYRVNGATECKYMGVAELVPDISKWNILQNIDKTKFDLCWIPDPREPAYIYTWGNKYVPAEIKPTLEYHVPGATERKYMGDIEILPEIDCWIEYEPINKNKFDLCWRPDPREPAYIYTWGNKYVPGELRSTLEYIVPGATDRKYMGDVEVLPQIDRWTEHQSIDKSKFDLSWRPDPREPAYIYTWGNKYIPAEIQPTLEYIVPGAAQRKYMGDVEVLPQLDRWTEHQLIDRAKFDLAWRPDPREPAYIYTWGNKYVPAEIKPTLEYKVPNATEHKYMGDVAVIPEINKWVEHQLINKSKFDLSWRPDPREPAYIYTWGNKYIPAEIQPTLEYIVPGATERKYMGDVEVLPEINKWVEYQRIDKSKFDLAWRPDPREPAYIYTWGNKYVPAEIKPTLEYIVPDATDRKYMGDIEVLPEYDRWVECQSINKNEFDFTWRPDPREPAYIYTWGNKYVPAEIKPTLEYHVPGTIDRKYMGDVDVLPELDRWSEYQLIDKSKFDLCWRPDPREPAYIYTWGNKYIPAEIQPTLEYIVPGATERKYMGDVDVLPENNRYTVYQETANFDFTWRPDPREPAYIYTWGNKYIPAEIQPTLEYIVPGATERKYIGDVEVLPELDKWRTHFSIDNTKFDLCWRPDPREPAYIYTWGNKYIPAEIQPTLEYHAPGATQRKYMGEVEVLPQWENYKSHTVIKNFDFTWRPDPREPAYIYTWGNKYIPAEIQPTLEYIVPGATERKYMGNVEVLPELDRWTEHQSIDKSKFDLSWRPDPREPAYIYTWGNKYIPAEIQPTLEYHVPGATDRKYMGNVEVLPELDRWTEYQLIDRAKFDLSWRPDPREPAYIYTWGNKYIPAEIQPTLEYIVPGATERKYMGNVEVLPELDRWTEYQLIDRAKFDLSWRPDPREPAYIYVWGNKYIRPEISPTIVYTVPGATEYKYIQESIEVLPEIERWNIIQDVVNFDFAWRPDPREPAYIYTWGNKYIPAEIQPTLEYHVPGATDRKYMGDVEVVPEWDNYQILIPIDKTKFDFSWRPNPNEPPYIYVWGNQSNTAEVEPTVEYYCEGASERKYMHDRIAYTLPDFNNWKILIPVDDFDFSWRPEPGSPPYIYVFGNQWHDAATEPTIEYHVQGAVDKKYITTITAKVSKTQQYWKTLIPVDNFDYSWRPNPHSQPYIYVFGNQWNNAVIEPTVEYHQPGAKDKKYITELKAVVKSTATDVKWKRLIDIETFDYSWRPDPGSPPYIYVFGNKWNEAATEPTIEYHVEGAVDKKYMNEPVAIPKSELRFWSVSNSEDLETFDFTWRPNPHSPPQVYQWENNGPTYTTPGAKDVVYMKRDGVSIKTIVNRYYIKTTLEDLVKEHSNEVFWALNPDLNYENFDFKWSPNEENFRHINVFGNEYSKDTQTYYVNGPMYTLGYRNFNYIETYKVENVDTNLSMFFIDRGNKESASRYQMLKEIYPKLQKTRYLSSWVDTISRCVKKSETKLFWILSSELDYSDFKFDFYPSTWQLKMIHVFGTQWSHWGNTYLINGETFLNDTKYVKIIEHLSNLNFVKTKKAKAVDCLYDIYFIDFENKESNEIKNTVVEKNTTANVYTIPFNENYYKTFKSILPKAENKSFIWVCSSICKYDSFDFSYVCDPFAKDQLHVFPSNKQKFGDTFLVNVEKLKNLIHKINKLTEYDGINFNQHQKVERLEAPIVVGEFDTHVPVITQEFDFPYANFVDKDNKELITVDQEPMSMWSKEAKAVKIMSTGASYVIIPKEAKAHVRTQIYDYPYITENNELLESRPMDIVFLSNGESNSDENYEHLLKITKNYNNRVIRIDGIKGRANAYREAAKASNTPWMFTVFAKLRVNLNFDWNWQPDRLQLPKHYIFNAKNPVNNLIYGHQAMIAYNKNLVLNNDGYGLDFTLDDPHESVDIYSGMAYFNTDSFSTWRTAFREAIKLYHDDSEVSKQRLEVWLTTGSGDFAEYSIKGANDGIKYYTEVNGEFDKLKLSYEWEWLKDRYKHDNP